MQSGDVNAFRNVAKDPFASCTNGSFTGYFSEPHSTECSIMCGTPVSSYGSVRNPIANVLQSSSRSNQTSSAPFFSYSIRTIRPLISGRSVIDFTANPLTLSPTANVSAAQRGTTAHAATATIDIMTFFIYFSFCLVQNPGSFRLGWLCLRRKERRCVCHCAVGERHKAPSLHRARRRLVGTGGAEQRNRAPDKGGVAL